MVKDWSCFIISKDRIFIKSVKIACKFNLLSNILAEPTQKIRDINGVNKAWRSNSHIIKKEWAYVWWGESVRY